MTTLKCLQILLDIGITCTVFFCCCLFVFLISDALNLGYKSSLGEKNSKEIMLDDLPHSEFYKENENINSVH